MADQNKELPQWLEKVEYLRLAQAAEIMGYPVDVLLHLGVLGELEIRAPVLMAGEYGWSIADSGLRELWVEVSPSSTRFDYRDRVVLFAEDLASIEATGSVALRRFYSPEVMAEIADSLYVKSVRKPGLNMIRPTEDVLKAVVAGGATTPWFAVDVSDSDQEAVVLLSHLWIAVTELRRFYGGKPQDEAAQDRAAAEKASGVDRRTKQGAGSAKRHSSNREQVLIAALTCLYSQQPKDLQQTAVALAKQVDEKGLLFWKSGAPPLSADRIERLLRECMRFPAERPWEGGKVPEDRQPDNSPEGVPEIT